MIEKQEVETIVQARFNAWAGGNIRSILDLYEDDVRYWDCGVNGMIKGLDDLRDYWKSYWSRFDIQYQIVEQHHLSDANGMVTLWNAAIRSKQEDGQRGSNLIMQPGMNIIEIRRGKIFRDECYNNVRMFESLRIR